MKLPDIKKEKTPKGKRSIRDSVYGNINGYVSGRFWKTFGSSHSNMDREAAERWRDGLDEEAPTNAVGTGQIAGAGVGPQGEPAKPKKNNRWAAIMAYLGRKKC